MTTNYYWIYPLTGERIAGPCLLDWLMAWCGDEFWGVLENIEFLEVAKLEGPFSDEPEPDFVTSNDVHFGRDPLTITVTHICGHQEKHETCTNDAGLDEAEWREVPCSECEEYLDNQQIAEYIERYS